MKKNILLTTFLSLTLCVTLCGCTTSKTTKISKAKPKIAVSIAPLAGFVKTITNGNVDVVTVIPSGYSAETYSPTPTQLQNISNSVIYFSIGMPNEKAKILPALKDLNPNIKLIELDKEVAKKYPVRTLEPAAEHEDEHDHASNEPVEPDAHDHSGIDPHIWLSPRRALTMVNIMTTELLSLDPTNASTYTENSKLLVTNLQNLDANISNSIRTLKDKSFIVFHPALGYFADDYGLTMVSLEVDGKAATPESLKYAIAFAKEHNIKVILHQPEFSSKQATVFANEIGGRVETVDTLSENYISTIESLLSSILKKSE